MENYIEIYEDLVKDSPKDREGIYLNSILRAKIEWDFFDVAAAGKSIVTALNHMSLREDGFETLIKLAIFTGNLDLLVKNYEELLKEALRPKEAQDEKILKTASPIVKAFLYYQNYLLEVEDYTLEEILLNSTLDQERSLILYIISLLTEDKEDKVSALIYAYKECNRNLAVVKALYLLGEDINLVDLSLLFRLDSTLVKASKESHTLENQEKKYNFNFMPIGGGEEIGANSYLLTLDKLKVIIDAGVKVSKDEKIYPNYQDIKEEIKELKYGIITHGHFDHCGGILRLYSINPNIIFIMNKETKALMEVTLKNAYATPAEAYIIDKILGAAIILDFQQTFTFKETRVSIKLYRAGHILGAAGIFFKSLAANVFYTGDFSLEKQLTVEALELPIGEKIDILITENTNGKKLENQRREGRVLEIQRFKYFVRKAIEEDKKIVIPVHGVGIPQEVIYALREVSQEINFRLYVESNIVEVTEVYEKYSGLSFQGRNIHYLKNSNKGNVYKNREDFIKQEFLNNKSCVVTNSTEYLKYILPMKEAACLLTGYQGGVEALHQLLNQRRLNCDRYITLEEEVCKVNCALEKFYLGYHGEFEDILAIIEKTQAKKVILIHGESKKNNNHLVKAYESIDNIEIYQSRNSQVINL